MFPYFPLVRSPSFLLPPPPFCEGNNSIRPPLLPHINSLLLFCVSVRRKERISYSGVHRRRLRQKRGRGFFHFLSSSISATTTTDRPTRVWRKKENPQISPSLPSPLPLEGWVRATKHETGREGERGGGKAVTCKKPQNKHGAPPPLDPGGGNKSYCGRRRPPFFAKKICKKNPGE